MFQTPPEASTSHAGMGAIVHPSGVAFRVWAPHADLVSVVGQFNDFAGDIDPMHREPSGYWYADVPSAKPGDQYKFRITRGEDTFDRIDPYAREVTNSVGNAVVYDDQFDW